MEFSVCTAAQNPVRHSFGIALLEQFILTLAQAVKESLAVDRLHSTAHNVVVAAIEHFADFCHFCQIPRQGIFHEVVGRAATLGGELSQARLCLRLNVHFHDCQFRDVDWLCQGNCREKERPSVRWEDGFFPTHNPSHRVRCLVRLTVTAEVASSSLVVPAILNKDFTLIFMKPARVQKDTNLHPFVALSLITVNSLLWFLLCPALRNIGNRCLAPRRG